MSGITPWEGLLIGAGACLATLALLARSRRAHPPYRPARRTGPPPRVPDPAPGPPLPPHLADFADRIRAEAEKRDVPLGALPTLGYSNDGACPYLYVDDLGYHLAAEERGIECEHRTTSDYDELLYWTFEHASGVMASHDASYRLRHADEYGPLLIARQGELLKGWSPAWHERWLIDTQSRAEWYRRHIANG